MHIKQGNILKTNRIIIALFRLLMIPRLFGLFPYWRDFEQNIFGVGYSIINIILLVACASYSVYTVIYSTYGASVDSVLDVAQISLIHCTLIYAIFTSIIRRSTYVNAVDCLKDSAYYIKRFGSSVCYDCFEPFVLLLKVINIVAGAYTLIATQISNIFYDEIIIFFTTVSLLSIKQSELIAFLSIMNSQLISLNNQLIYLKNTPTYPGKITKIEFILAAYSKLAQSCDHLNSIYSSQFFMLTVTTILIKTASLFSFVKVYLHHVMYGSQMTFYGYINHFFLMAIFSFESLLVIFKTSCIKYNANKVSSLLYSVSIEDPTGMVVNNNKVKVHFARDRKVVFSALGFFPVDNTLLQTITSLVANYIVLLIQFGLKTGCNGIEEL